MTKSFSVCLLRQKNISAALPNKKAHWYTTSKKKRIYQIETKRKESSEYSFFFLSSKRALPCLSFLSRILNGSIISMPKPSKSLKQISIAYKGKKRPFSILFNQSSKSTKYKIVKEKKEKSLLIFNSLTSTHLKKTKDFSGLAQAVTKS